jgi:hypothetical protein
MSRRMWTLWAVLMVSCRVSVIYAHPTYDRALWIFSQRNPLRRLCQRFVEPAHGDRIFGVQPHRSWAAAFRLVILGAIIGSVTVAAVATPVYRRGVSWCCLIACS